MNVVSGLLASGALVPALSQVIATGRRCDLVLPERPHSPIVEEMCDWMVQEFESDITSIRLRHPDMGRSLLDFDP